MTADRVKALRHWEGQRFSLSLVGGDRIDDCQLVSAGRPGCRTMWIFSNGADRFVSYRAVVDCWESLS